MQSRFAIREFDLKPGQKYLALVHAENGKIVKGQKEFSLRSDPHGRMTVSVTLEFRDLKIWHEAEA